MKVVFIVVLSILLATTAIAAAQTAPSDVKVITSFYPVYIMALNVTKGVPGVSVSNLTPPVTGCLHDYALTAGDMKKIASADIFIANGAGMESFLDNVIAQYPKLDVVELATGVEFIKDGKEVNPHVWVSISNAIIEVKNLGIAMEKFDPTRAQAYRKNTDEYVNKLNVLRLEMLSSLAPYKGRQIITFHEAFPYFAQEIGLQIAAVIERQPGSSPDARELAGTIDLIKRAGIRAIFCEPQYPSAAAKIIAGETGAKIYTLDPAVTGPDDPNAYIDIMEKNCRVLKEALGS